MTGENTIFLRQAAEILKEHTGKEPVSFFRSPGRCEFIGNHTDHQGGHVVAAAIDLAMTAAVSPNGEGILRVFSNGFSPVSVDLRDLALRPEEKGTSAAFVRGVAAVLTAWGFPLSGFDAAVVSTLPVGGGFSSSAAFSCLIGTVFNDLCCQNRLTPLQIAQAAQKAETEYFGKPCGLMDQLACVTGGFAAMDFSDPAAPTVKALSIDLSAHGFTLLAVDTGTSHADLTKEYAAIPAEMKKAAAAFGKERLCEVPAGLFFASLAKLQRILPARALTRAMHYFEEDNRAVKMADALQQADLPRILSLIHLSGDSSQRLLQNTRPAGAPAQQGPDFALELSRQFCPKGAFRVHGGGFAGSILALVPTEEAKDYIRQMEEVFGAGACRVLTVSSEGAKKL